MRHVAMTTVAVAAFIVATSGVAGAADPAPRTVAGQCAKEVGGYYDPARKLWLVPPRLVAAKNACIARRQGGR